MRNILYMGLCLALLWGCGKDDPPAAPGPVSPVFPGNNSLCVTGVSVSETTSEVTFRWQASSNADRYEVVVTHLGTSNTQRQVTSGLSLAVVLQKGTPYSWQGTAINQESGKETPGPVWQFFNAGASQFYPPFPARVLEPASGASVLPDSEGQVLLRWELADVDNDLRESEVYLGEDPSALTLITTLNHPASQFRVPVTPGGVYYWQVLSRDARGNTSLSGLYSFRAL
jgi:hypothetical protein